MSGVAWWVPWALAFCAVVFTGGVLVLVVLAGRGVWRLVGAWRREPLHAGPVGERFWPWDTDPRFGSMQLEDDRWARVDWAMTAYPPPTVPPRDWRDQTRADLAPAALDSGPGGPSLAPGPDLPTMVGAPIFGVPGLTGHWVSGPPDPEPEPEPEPVWTVAGRLVETSGEWLRRLERDAGPGWTYAGTVAA